MSSSEIRRLVGGWHRQLRSPKGKYNDIPVQPTKAHGGAEAQVQSFVTPALGAVSDEHHVLAASSPG
jgi:hypothetical protein